ncbi:hypothetical protein N5F00_19325 [Pseudomonas chengduensis]|nr:hypothetical protein [Pseudomonas chengduensis]MDH1731650.1 hypothetical protein [Pseudomonas chengduensis]
MRVLILEDDPWIADLLKQIVLSLRPGARVDCRTPVADALAAWPASDCRAPTTSNCNACGASPGWPEARG